MAAGDGGNRAQIEQQRRTRRLIVLLVALLVVLAVIAFFLVNALTGSKVAVPNVVGRTQAMATQTLQGDNLAVGDTTTKTSPSVTKGDVISTDPAAGTKVAKNSQVDLLISAGPTVVKVNVPSVVGQQFTDATAALSRVGLSYKVTYVTSDKPAGTVLKQSPAGNTTVPNTTQVKLTVVQSQITTTVPNVVGFTQASAGSAITGASLKVGNQTTACSQQVTTGNVASQTPAANTQQPTNTPINLVISSGPCSATVPNVVGQTQSLATATISNTPGLTSTTNQVDCSQSGGASGTVESQSPSAGTVLSPPFPQTVTLSVCSATTTTTTTPPASTTTTPTTAGGNTKSTTTTTTAKTTGTSVTKPT
jgi:beta-lactam-binding protein with PASTA domain